MLQKIINFSIQNKLIIGLFTLVLIGFGIYSLTKLPIDAVPDITNNQVQVITTVPSLGALDVERLITFPIEQANANIPGLHEIRSFSRFGLSLVTIVFDDATDVYWARQQVTERLQQVLSQLPEGIAPPTIAPVTTGLGEIYQYVVKPKKGYESAFDATSLRTIQDWIVRRQLLGVKGVADVSSFGGKLKQYEIAVNPERLNAMQLSIEDVFTALEKNNQNTGGAYIENGPTIQYIRSEGLIDHIDDIKSIVVKNNENGIPIIINDVAEVKFGNAIRYGAVCYNNDGEVAGAVVMMLKGENSSAVIKRVKERVEQIKKTLPEGVEIEPFLDRTKMVNNAISTVEKNLIEGALIVIFILVIFLGNIRAGLITASVIPLSMLFAVIMMNAFGVSGNLMSLGAIDFGLIVDGAVIIVEGVMHTLVTYKFSNELQLNKTGLRKEIDGIVSNSAGKLMSASLFGQLIILIVYLPIFSLQGIEGKMFKPMAQTVTFALMGAFILSLTYIPMMTALFINKPSKASLSDRVMLRIENKFQTILQRMMQFPKSIIMSVLALFVFAVIVLTQLGGEFIPALEEGDFAVDTRVMTGSNLNTTIEKTQLAAKTLLRHFPEVEKVVTKIGSGEIPTDPMPIEASDMMVILKPKKEWTSAKTFDELSAKMKKQLDDIPGITAGFQFPVQMRFNELMTGARQDVVCKIFGEDLDTLSRYADILGKIVNTVSGTENLYIEPIEGLPQIVIKYNRPLIAQYGLNIADINKTVNTAFAGQVAGQVFEGEKRFELIVRLQNESRKSIKDIASLLVTTPSGLQIPLDQIANVQLVNSANQIQREDAKRRIVIGFNVGGRDVESIVKELQDKISKQVKFPSGYYVNYGGSFENLKQAKNRLQIAVPVALFLIFLLLYFAFGSVKQGLLVYSAIPLSAIGGILLLAARDLPFSISAGIGFIALFGVAVLNGIVLINEFNNLRANSDDAISDIVIKGTKTRLRPVLMTASVASLGFIPMALSNGAGAEVQRPLATVVIGGLITATFLTLFVLPVLYVWFEHKIEKKITIKNIKVKHISTLLLLVFLSQWSNAQTSISLPDALEMAVGNQYQIQALQKNIAYYHQLKSAVKVIPKTAISSEFGQFNSKVFDSKFSINQGIPWPGVYKAQQHVMEAQADIVQTEIIWNTTEVKTQIKLLYYEYLILKEKELMLKKANDLFENFYHKSLLRFNKGETDILEKTSAESQMNDIQIQLHEISSLIKQNQLLFNYFLNASQTYTPSATSYKYEASYIDNEKLDEHPLLVKLQKENILIKTQQQAEKKLWWPELNVGINNQSLIGWQKINNQDQYFNASHRFTSGVVGLNVPLFRQASKQKIASYQLLLDQNQLMIQHKNQELKQQYSFWVQELKSSEYIIDKYESNLLKNARTIQKTVGLQLQKGEIDYFKWAMMILQSVQIEKAYLQYVHQYNQAIIQLQKIQNQ
ncbi:MAG: CusA/CzcA family heavy metal efflux RND transporter [Bacteroidetes bacterium]|nr:CusA/CzcA family heavy metal efflux RND transporter [Bacteroidota bacterium]